MIARLHLREDGRRLLTYGKSQDADLILRNVRSDTGKTIFDAELGPRVTGGARKLNEVTLAYPGEYNALNALAAIAVASEAGLSDDTIRDALANFSGVKRRFQPTGTWNGVSFFDDYAHHPIEIAAVLKAARAGARGRVIGVVEPHRYSRVADLFDEFSSCFSDADTVIVAPLYTAGESPIEGIDHNALAEGIRAKGHKAVVAVPSQNEIATVLSQIAQPNDMVICMGAGTLTEMAHRLPAILAAEPKRAGGAL